MKKPFKRFGTMLDCSRNAVMNLKSVKNWIDMTADLGFNMLMLYTEDTWEVENQPKFGYLRGRYTTDEIKELDAYAESKGVELIPCIQTLGHLNQIFHWSEYSQINDIDDILLVGDDKTYKLIDDMFSTVSKTFKTKVVHIGMDETHKLGRGKYYDIHGENDHFKLLEEHLIKVAEIAKKYDFELLMWGDMYFRLCGGGYYHTLPLPDDIGKLVPDNVHIVYWDYYGDKKERYLTQIDRHEFIKKEIWFAGGLWSWTGFAPHNDYSFTVSKPAMQACREKEVENVFLTIWGDGGGECSRYSLLPSLFFATEIAKGNESIDIIKQKFQEKFSIPFDDFMLLDLPMTPNVERPKGFGDWQVVNMDRYALFSDCFMGFLDSTISPDDGEKFKKNAEALEKYENNEQFGHIFKSMASLCRVLSLKCDIGILTRNAYDKKDKNELKKLVSVYDEILVALDKFYRNFKNQWFIENKPEGFEIQDARLGGLYFRIRHCKERLSDYIDGKIDRIEELELPLLPYREGADGIPICNNNYKNIISASQI